MLLLTLLIPVSLLVTETWCDDIITDRPIIGIVAEDGSSDMDPKATSVIWASYVKFVESGGARVVPILLRQPKEYYEDLLKKINGVLLPGSGDIDESGYGKTGKIIFDIAVKMNQQGDWFPVWGTGNGFQLLNYLAVNKLWATPCKADDITTNINFQKGFKKALMFKYADSSIIKTMEKYKVAVHYHHRCFTPENYTLSGLNKYFKVLGLSKDANNMTFVSVIQAEKYPFYGISFHPEKAPYEWIQMGTHRHISHDKRAIQTSQYFANFFVDVTKYNNHTFPSREAEDAALIYNYDPVFTGKEADYPSYQSYLFS